MCWNIYVAGLVCCTLTALQSAGSWGDLVLRESFDIPVGTLDNQAGVTSFGFHPTVGTVWDSGIFGARMWRPDRLRLRLRWQDFTTRHRLETAIRPPMEPSWDVPTAWMGRISLAVF